MNTKFTYITLTIVCFLNLNIKGSAGVLDATFNPSGTPPGTSSTSGQGWAIASQSDGKVILGGSNGGFQLVRYTTAGALDATFGAGGIVITNTGSLSSIAAITIQPDGKIIAVGTGEFSVARYNTNGTLDASFGTGGTVTATLTGGIQASSMALQTDGKIIVAGGSADVTKFVVARFTASGTLDTTFGTAGFVTTSFSSAFAHGVTLQPDGKVVVGGSSSSGGQSNFTLIRYNTSGALDSTFGAGGIVVTNMGVTSVGRGIAMQPATGKIVLVGNSGPGVSFHLTIARYNLDGTLDGTFGTNGIVTTVVGTQSYATSVAIQQGGKIVVAGASQQSYSKWLLARYTMNGTLDTTFGTGGITITTNTAFSSEADGVAIQNNGKIVVGGTLSGVSTAARYFGDKVIIDVCTL